MVKIPQFGEVWHTIKPKFPDPLLPEILYRVSPPSPQLLAPPLLVKWENGFSRKITKIAYLNGNKINS